MLVDCNPITPLLLFVLNLYNLANCCTTLLQCCAAISKILTDMSRHIAVAEFLVASEMKVSLNSPSFVFFTFLE